MDREGRGRFDIQGFQEAERIERDVRLEDVFRAATKMEHRGVLLLGDPGAGKTTGARQLCWRLASGFSTPADLGLPPGTLPVLIRFRNLHADDVPGGLEKFVHRETAARGDSEALQPGVESWAFDGSLLWIFYGLDEVVDESARSTASQWLVQLLQDRTRDRVLVTGRYQGIEGKIDLGSEFVRFEVQPLDVAQSGSFVHTWFRVAYPRLGLDRETAPPNSCI